MRQLISSLFILLASIVSTNALSHTEHVVRSIPLHSKVLPIWDQKSQQLEGFLYLDLPSEKQIAKRWQLRSHSLDAVFGLSSVDSLGFLCSHYFGTPNLTLHRLADHCLLARFGDNSPDHQISATAELNGQFGRYGVSAATTYDALAPFYQTNSFIFGRPYAHVNQNDLTIFGLHGLGKEGFISVDGTYARARLVSMRDAASAFAGQWNCKTFSVRGGFGAFSASIIGHVVVAQGRPAKWKGLDLGLSWRTPWSGHLSVGAENIISRGKNPFSAENALGNTSTTPYVRYEQDL